jgi:pyrroline-5-carboxylate reductase
VNTLGFIGTGHLAAFFVEGLAQAEAGYAITVSARNQRVSDGLRERYGVRVADDNQHIADRCELVVVSVLPQQARDVLAPLNFRAGQSILSVMAGVSRATLESLAAPATCALAMMPGHANAFNIGPSVLYPDEPRAHRLLKWLGPVHTYDDEGEFTAASVMGAFSGLTMLLMRDAANWFTANGIAPEDARALVAETLRGNAHVLLNAPATLDQITRGVATPGGITELGRQLLDQGKSWNAALDAVLRRISR